MHGRSAFLQGILLTDAMNLPDYFRQFSNVLDAYSDFLTKHKLSRLTATLGFMMEQSGVDKMVVGVTSLREFEDILDALSRPFVLPRMDRLACGDVDLTDPRRWPLSQPAQVASNP